jgi:preprotein translocase subunit SecD
MKSLLLLAALAVLVGCQSPPTKVVTLHEVLDQPPSAIVPQVNPNPIFGSKDITEAEYVPAANGNGHDILCKTDRPGAHAWFQASRTFRNRPVAVLLDGKLLHIIVPPAAMWDDQYVFRIPGPFDEDTAEEIAEEAEDNHRKLNGAQ